MYLYFLCFGCVYTLKFTTPEYKSSITLVLVSSTNSDESNTTITTSDITLNSKLLSTYNKLIKSKNVLKKVISNLEIQIDEDTLRDNITVSSINNTELIEIEVVHEEPTYAVQIANELAKVFDEEIKEMYNINNIQLIDEADIPSKPYNIDHKKDIIIFTFIGFVIAVVYVIVVNMLDTTIKSPENVEKEFGLPVLASIPLHETKDKKRR